jgi:KaiC/GvpD/RAD55 family RecA-like ATPase
MLAGKQEFVLVDDQKVVYETALSLAKCSTDQSKQVVIIQGGPGTGKSVVAINLLVALTGIRLVAKYVTKNAAPRDVFESVLAGTHRKSQISNLFSGSGAFTETRANVLDALVARFRVMDPPGFG